MEQSPLTHVAFADITTPEERCIYEVNVTEDDIHRDDIHLNL